MKFPSVLIIIKPLWSQNNLKQIYNQMNKKQNLKNNNQINSQQSHSDSTEAEVFNRKDQQIISNIQYFILTNKLIFIQFSISSIFLYIQYFYIPLLQGKLYTYTDYQYILFIIQILSIFIGISYFVKGLEYSNLQTEQLSKINTISLKIIKQLRCTNQKYSFERLLSCKKRLDILECYAINSKQFLIDQNECLKQNMQIQLNFLELKYKMEIINSINPQHQSILSKKLHIEDNMIKFRILLSKLKETYFKDIIQQKYQEEELLIDYNQFISLFKNFEITYKNIKKNNIIQKGNYQLRKFENIDHSELKLVNKYSNKNYLISYDLQSQFEFTLLSNLVNKINNNNEQSICVDNAISELQYENFESDVINIERIYGLIEDKEGIESIKEDQQDIQEKIKCININNNIIRMQIKQAEDKTPENISKKINRKNNEFSPQNIPWSIKLIKDWKRMSIVFKNELDIFLFLDNKKKLFGNDYSKELYFETENIVIRIQQIKNGFLNIKSDEESGNYRDLKIIQEVLVINMDISFFIECQVNLENLMIQKKVDHIIQTFTRAKILQENFKDRQDSYEQMEGNLRLFLQTIRIFFIMIAISAFGISLGIILNDINLKMKTIQHANRNISVNFIEGHQPNNICYTIDKEEQNCIGDTQINSLIQNNNIKQFQKLESNGYSLIGIDHEYRIISKNLNNFQNITVNEKIYDIKQNNKLICQSTEKNIICIHRIIYPNILSAFDGSACISTNNSLECFGQFKYLNDVYFELQSGVNLLSLGQYVNCASIDKQKKLICQGRNIQGLLDIPDVFSSGVTLLEVDEYNICAGTDKLVKCWGLVLSESEDFANVDFGAVNLNNIPIEVALGAESIKLSFCNVCALNSSILYCWGWNQTGINDIPDEFKNNVQVLSINSTQVCVYASIFKCWGTNLYNISSHIPSVVSSLNSEIKLIDMTKDQICVSSHDLFECWGDGQAYIRDQITKDIINVDQFSLGISILCVSQNHNFECYYSNDINGIDKIDNLKYNWSLPSIEYKTSYVQNCGEFLCIQKGYLFCQKYLDDYSIQPIITPQEMNQSKQFKIAESGNICGTINSKLVCWNFSSFDDESKLEVPIDFESGTNLYSLGYYHICATKMNLVDCWGINYNGEIDIPEDVRTSSIHSLSSQGALTCASSTHSLNCWGMFLDYTSPNLLNEITEIFEIPEILKSGVDKVGVGQAFVCALKTLNLTCFGHNRNGQTDIPSEFQEGDVELFSIGSFHACAQSYNILRCWGSIRNDEQIPKQLNGVNDLISCSNENCALWKDEWVCWGSDGIPQRLNVTQETMQEDVRHFDIEDEYSICINYDTQVECRSNQIQYGRQTVPVSVHDSFMCLYVYLSVHQFCQVHSLMQYKFECLKIVGLSSEQLQFSQVGNSKVTKVSCGTTHACALYQSGEVHCFGGSEEQDEANLPQEMMNGVQDIRAGANSTCILNSTTIVCRGKDIDKNKDEYSLISLKGFEEIINFN